MDATVFHLFTTKAAKEITISSSWTCWVLDHELAHPKVTANRVAKVIANEWKDPNPNDKVMPVKQWLEERMFLQGETPPCLQPHVLPIASVVCQVAGTHQEVVESEADGSSERRDGGRADAADVKKKGLKKAGASGVRAGVGGYSYLYEPLWWIGMITMIVGEIANFAAYAFAPAILVTPLGALSIIISAVLAQIILKERLHIFGVVGCLLCVVGSTTIVLHAPPEREIESVIEVWNLATDPGFLFYAAVVITTVFILIFQFTPQYGQTHIMVYIGICSLVGSMSVMSVKALGIALKLTLSGMNQLMFPQTWAFCLIVAACVVTQMNYLNKALDTFNTAVVSPIYYVMFTSFTIVASVIMFKDWDRQNPTQILTEMCGFITILSGTFLLHKTKDMPDGLTTSLSMKLFKNIEENGFEDPESIPLRRQDSLKNGVTRQAQ